VPVGRRIVLWAGTDAWRAEEARVELGADGVRAEGTQLGIEPSPYRLTYALDASAGWLTRRLAVRVAGAAGAERSVLLEHDGAGAWRVDGVDVPALDGALDCDLSFSPLTNLMPVRRRGLHERGGAADFVMAWVDVPSLEVIAYRQRYAHLAAGRVRFTSLEHHVGFVADLELDADGLVERYPGLAERVGGAQA
jgi:uncharacterized protein